MTKIYKSARGKSIDIDRIKLANETTVAVGNMRINARGDQLGAGGEVATGRNALMDQVYAVPSAPTSGGYSPNDTATFNRQRALAEASNARQLNDLANNLAVPVTPATDATPVVPAARGSLASSVAKTATVVQEPLPNPKTKNNGPSRI